MIGCIGDSAVLVDVAIVAEQLRRCAIEFELMNLRFLQTRYQESVSLTSS